VYRTRWLKDLDVYGGHAFFSALGFERDSIAVADLVYQPGDMHENVLVGSLFHNEAESFGFVIEFDGSFVHEIEFFAFNNQQSTINNQQSTIKDKFFSRLLEAAAITLP
jgi:hypothetical protein